MISALSLPAPAAEFQKDGKFGKMQEKNGKGTAGAMVTYKQLADALNKEFAEEPGQELDALAVKNKLGNMPKRYDAAHKYHHHLLLCTDIHAMLPSIMLQEVQAVPFQTQDHDRCEC